MATTGTGESERAFGMVTEEIEGLLQRMGHGTLALARDECAYAVPMSYGYAGDRLYFVFRRPAERSRKLEFAAATDRASFLVSEVTTKDDWASVLVEGRLREVADDEWEALLTALDENAWFPSLFSMTEPMQDFVGYELLVDGRSGRKGSAYAV